MLTRREKMKRSVCKVQEQIFNLYVKLGEHEQTSGVHPSSKFENALLFNCNPASPDAPKIEDLTWHSAYFRKQLGKSMGCSMKVSHKREETWHEKKFEKSMFVQHQMKEKKEHRLFQTSCKNSYAESRTSAVQPKSESVVTEHKKRRDNHIQYEATKADSKEKHLKASHKLLKPAGLSQKQIENKRAATCSGDKPMLTGSQRPSLETMPRCNQPLIKMHYNQTAVKTPTIPRLTLKNWGGFRIPKKGEKHQGAPQQDTGDQNAHQYSEKAAPKDDDQPKERVKADNENDGYVPDAEMSDSETEAKDEYRQQRLTTNSTVNRRYETDIRQSILAS